EEFLNQYKKIESIRITLKKRNDELQFKNDLIKKAQLKTDAIKSSTTTISFTNKKDGLDFDQTLEQLDEATEQGNQGILIEGINESGDVIKGNNEKFKVILILS
ncbi:hypothetical protein K034_4520, partial [Acinetobacter baumannii 42057_3]|uniref:hypothetical protein n=1 Tax=Acinetobacter baumannii TaxID=470 RepID=UPI000460D48F